MIDKLAHDIARAAEIKLAAMSMADFRNAFQELGLSNVVNAALPKAAIGAGIGAGIGGLGNTIRGAVARSRNGIAKNNTFKQNLMAGAKDFGKGALLGGGVGAGVGGGIGAGNTIYNKALDMIKNQKELNSTKKLNNVQKFFEDEVANYKKENLAYNINRLANGTETDLSIDALEKLREQYGRVLMNPDSKLYIHFGDKFGHESSKLLDKVVGDWATKNIPDFSGPLNDADSAYRLIRKYINNQNKAEAKKIVQPYINM